MRVPKYLLIASLSCAIYFMFFPSAMAQEKKMLVRIAEITLFPEHVEAYKLLLQEEAEASIRLEEGVLVIFPMFAIADSSKVKILEIYASQEAYESHLKTAHFLKYKTLTQTHVKDLKLLDMYALDPLLMPAMFKRITE